MKGNISLYDLHPTTLNLRKEVLAGLRRPDKKLPCLLFYDDQGSRLFDQICDLDEYYPTRTEIEILRQSAPAIEKHIGERAY
jgi:uncharacterized SAM-dependent methyltransferase